MSDEHNSASRRRQIKQFCAYGFLKNLQFFEPFLILAFLDKGFSFTSIGVLISFRAICVNLLEIPSGVIADIWGRRKAMICSMSSYIASFILFAAAKSYIMFFPAMFLFSLGEAFRTGTHKAMIFNWITREGIQDQKTRIYGLTRSWSKQGSSLNCIVAAAIMIFFNKYEWVFALAVVPYALNIINLALYPRYMDEHAGTPPSLTNGMNMLKSGLKLVYTRPSLSGLILENICFEGIFSVVKDYLQPLLKAAAISLPILLTASGQTRTAILVAIVYFILNQTSSAASRLSHRAVTASGSEHKLGRILWLSACGLYLAMLAGLNSSMTPIAIAAFVLLFILLNIWKPAFVSRFHDQAEDQSASTTLSIANQSKTLVIAITAPLLGLTIDRSSLAIANTDAASFWPIAALGIAASMTGLCINRLTARTADA